MHQADEDFWWSLQSSVGSQIMCRKLNTKSHGNLVISTIGGESREGEKKNKKSLKVEF